MMDPCLLQKTVRDNSTDLHNYMLGLKNWEESAKKKEREVIYGIDKNENNKEKEMVTRDDVEYVKTAFDDGCRQMKNKKWDLAEKSFTNAIRKYSKNPAFFIKRAKCYMKLKKPDQAEEDCTKALSIDPKILKAKLQRSQAREMKGHLRGACLDLQDILILDPSNQMAKNALNRLKPLFEESLRKEDNNLFEEEEVSKKTGIGDSILESLAGTEDRSDANALNDEKILLANAEKEKGNHFVKLEKWKDAIESYSKAVEYNPNDAIFYANRALCYLKTKEEHRAILDCCMALNKNPRYVKVYMRRAAAKKAVGDLWGARYDVKQVLKLEPNNSQAKSDLEELNVLIEKNIPQKKKETLPLDTKSSPQKENSATISTKEKRGFNYVLAVNKPPHLRSKKPLMRVPIKFIDDSPKELFNKSEPKSYLSHNEIQEFPNKMSKKNQNIIDQMSKKNQQNTIEQMSRKNQQNTIEQMSKKNQNIIEQMIKKNQQNTIEQMSKKNQQNTIEQMSKKNQNIIEQMSNKNQNIIEQMSKKSQQNFIEQMSKKNQNIVEQMSNKNHSIIEQMSYKNHNIIEQNSKMFEKMERSVKMEEKKIIEIKDKNEVCVTNILRNQSQLIKDLTSNRINESASSPNDFQYILPIMKKPHLRSKKPLQRIPVKFIV